MNENIDLTKILKDCPKGTKLYTPIWGEVTFIEVRKSKDCFLPICITTIISGSCTWLTKEGCYINKDDAECIIFPSKDQRDWSKFTAPWYKKLVEPKFKVGDKIINIPKKYMGTSGTQGTILKITEDKYIFTDGSYMHIGDQDSWEWVIDKKPKFNPKTLKPFDKVLVKDFTWENWNCQFFSHISNTKHPYAGICSIYKMCIPYNDETKHLVGTNEEAPEYYKYWED